MKNSIGIMQGRLTEPRGRGIQFFPFENWENEFIVAAELGINEIEFIFDFYDYENNPLWSTSGLKKISKIIEQTNVKVHSICFDYFMRRPFYKLVDVQDSSVLRKENLSFLERIIKGSEYVGYDLVEVPIIDDSAMKNEEEKDQVEQFIIEILSKTDTYSHIYFGLETDLNPHSFKDYLDRFENRRVVANYDSGNSSGRGYNQFEEIMTLNTKIKNIHIKDRKYQGNTVELGTGSADFQGMFKGTDIIKYKGSYILQAARGIDGNERANIEKQIFFLNRYIFE